MEPYETYTSVLVALSVALLLIASGLAKKQLVWKRPRPVRVLPAQVIGGSRPAVSAPTPRIGGGPPILDDESRAWLHALTGDGRSRGEAVLRLRALLLRAARFEAARRRDRVPHVDDRELDELARTSADAALMRATSCLDHYRGGSRFTTWAAKFAIVETAVRLRKLAWHHAQASPSALPELVSDELGSLTADQRHVFEALAVDGVPIDLFAEAMQRTRDDVYRTLQAARAVLRVPLDARGASLSYTSGPSRRRAASRAASAWVRQIIPR